MPPRIGRCLWRFMIIAGQLYLPSLQEDISEKFQAQIAIETDPARVTEPKSPKPRCCREYQMELTPDRRDP